MTQEPKSSYAISDFVRGKPGSFFEVVKLTFQRSFVILFGILLSRAFGLENIFLGTVTAFITSTIITIWIMVDYYIQIHYDASMFFYSGSPPK